MTLCPLQRQLGKGVPDLPQLKCAVLSQAHQSVIAAVGASLASTTANLGGTYPSAIETIRGGLDSKHSDSTKFSIEGMAKARETLAAFLNASPEEAGP